MSGENRTVINDRYELDGRAGRGGMADVFIARDLMLDRRVAIKLLFPEFATDPAFVERFRREAQAAANLNHPNIVGVYDWGKHNNTYYMAMEYVEGRTLADILRKQSTLRPEVAADVGMQVAAALASAHRNGVVHRDVKPANILIGSNGAIKVADFGIARAIDASHDSNLTQDGAVMGTATYFSPEQAQGAQPDPRSDIYSLGIVLYELVAGKPPFTGENALATAYKQVHDMPQPLNQLVPGIPRNFEVIVAKCLAKNPDLRYSTAEELREDLRRFRDGEELLAMQHAKALHSDNATTVMSAVNPQPGATQAIPVIDSGTRVMPASVAPSAGGNEFDENPPRNNKVFAGAVAALIAVIVGAAVLVMSISGGSSSGLASPDLLDKTYTEAAQLVLDAGLVAVPNPVAKDGVGPDVVYDQSPAPGTRLKRGDSISITYNPAKPPVQVPAIQGLSVAAATTQLQAAGLTMEVVEVREDQTLGVGMIISQDPLAPNMAPAGSTVKVVVSGGAGQVVIPDIKGFTAEAAQSQLQGKPFSFVVTVLQEASADVQKGLAVRTDPAIGTPIDSGSTVKLFVSAGPQQVSVPAVAGLDEGAARNLLTQKNLGADVQYVNLTTGDPNIGKVITQGTAANTLVDPGTKIVLTVGRLTTTSSAG